MYAWYEIVGYAVIVGILCFIIFRGLDLVLERWLERKQAQRLEALNRVSDTAEQAGEGLSGLGELIRNLRRGA